MHMHVAREGQQLVLTLSSLESAVLRHVLTELIRAYDTPPEQLDPKLAAAWYSRRGCETARMSADEVREWLQALHQFKSAALQQLRQWREALSTPTTKRGQARLPIPLTDAQVFMRALNDQRLALAARHNVGEAEMQIHTAADLAALDEDRQQAVFEIHLLAWIIEEILRLSAPEAANWMD